ncbi:hypothetical protein KQ693_01195 [Thermus sp. PS18]|uniref:hypothetical protein n=1 Tax=Thermus sp. PS18 TaxID=2849039 RepID=UPI0022654027|nr:hypothetical protein [Thermus sp. PS18]UZX15690.1 hypothetical protein KQ693_01195 [Thermus sp. PS18]
MIDTVGTRARKFQKQKGSIKSERRRKVSVSVTLLPEHRTYLEERAEEKGVSVSEYLRWLIEEHMSQHSSEERIWLYFTKEGDFDESTILPKSEGGLGRQLWHDITKLLEDYDLMRIVVVAKEDFKKLTPEERAKYQSFLHFLLEGFAGDALRGTVLWPDDLDIEKAIQYGLSNIRKVRFYLDTYLDKEHREFLEQARNSVDEE